MKLTKGTYPVAWEMGDLTLHARLQQDDDGYLSRWNGFVRPWFSRDEIDRYNAFVFAAPNDELAGDPLYTWLEWDGDTLVAHDPVLVDEGDDTYRMEPVDGLYDLGAGGWTWQIVESEL